MNPVSESPKKLMKYFTVGIEVFLHTPKVGPYTSLSGMVIEYNKSISSSVAQKQILIPIIKRRLLIEQEW